MIQEHPITPPPELVEQWLESTSSRDCIGAYPANYEHLICTHAARWGADQELEACCEWLDSQHHSTTWSSRIRAARRPKPPSLKDKALAALQVFGPSGDLTPDEIDAIRRALESLPD